MQNEYALAAVKGVKKSFDNAASADIMQYKDSRLFTFAATSEWTEIYNSTESMSGVKELAENEAPPVCTLDEGYQVSLTAKRFGGAIELTETDMQRAGDNTTLIDQYIQRKRNMLLVSLKSQFLTNIFALYNDAFTGTSYLAPDGAALCATHTWNSGGTFANNVTTVFGQGAVETMEEYAGAFTDAKGIAMPLTFNTIVVKKGSAAAREAKKLFGMYGMKPTSVSDINIYEGEYTLVETPYITTANKLNWFALAQNMENPLYVGILKMPAMNSPIVQNNESIRSNATGFYKVGIQNMPIAIYGSTGATA